MSSHQRSYVQTVLIRSHKRHIILWLYPAPLSIIAQQTCLFVRRTLFLLHRIVLRSSGTLLSSVLCLFLLWLFSLGGGTITYFHFSSCHAWSEQSSSDDVNAAGRRVLSRSYTRVLWSCPRWAGTSQPVGRAAWCLTVCGTSDFKLWEGRRSRRSFLSKHRA